MQIEKINIYVPGLNDKIVNAFYRMILAGGRLAQDSSYAVIKSLKSHGPNLGTITKICRIVTKTPSSRL